MQVYRDAMNEPVRFRNVGSIMGELHELADDNEVMVFVVDTEHAVLPEFAEGLIVETVEPAENCREYLQSVTPEAHGYYTSEQIRRLNRRCVRAGDVPEIKLAVAQKDADAAREAVDAYEDIGVDTDRMREVAAHLL